MEIYCQNRPGTDLQFQVFTTKVPKIHTNRIKGCLAESGSDRVQAGVQPYGNLEVPVWAPRVSKPGMRKIPHEEGARLGECRKRQRRVNQVQPRLPRYGVKAVGSQQSTVP
jgi:hypothetical protein